MKYETYEQLRERQDAETVRLQADNDRRMRALVARHRVEAFQVMATSQPRQLTLEMVRLATMPLEQIMEHESPQSAEYHDAKDVLAMLRRIGDELATSTSDKDIRVIPVSTIRWWHELASLNPNDLIPRLQAYLEEHRV